MAKKDSKKILQKVKEDYNLISKEFSNSRKKEWEEFQLIKKYLKNNAKILDLGCGNGRLLDFLKKTGKQFEYIGLDNSEKLLEEAKKLHPGYRFILADIQDIPFKQAKFDLVAAIASFHHIPGQQMQLQVLSSINKTLKSKGILVVTVWNLFQPKYKKYIWQSLKKYIVSLGKRRYRDTYIPWGNSGINRYYYAFKEKELSKLIKKSGFRILYQQKTNNLLFICQKKE